MIPTRDNQRSHINLEIALDAGQSSIGLSLHQPGEMGTLQQIVSHQVTLSSVTQRSDKIIKTLNQANRTGQWTAGLLSELKDAGQFFRDALLSRQVKEKIDTCQAAYLVLNLDETLLHLPWELMYDGHRFLSRRFAVGRLVRTRRSVGTARERSLRHPLNMLIIADPAGDLANAHGEGIQLRNHLERFQPRIRVGFRSDQVTADFSQSKLRHYDIVHFAGHCDYCHDDPYQTGWRLSQGLFSVDQVNRMAGTGTMPLLVYANACQSARSDLARIDDGFGLAAFGMANAFIMSGVKHHIGAVWEIADRDGRYFSENFYSQLLGGRSIGEALQEARNSLVDTVGEENLNWAGYLLYGNPVTTYFPQSDILEAVAEDQSGSYETEGSEVHTPVNGPEEVVRFSTAASTSSVGPLGGLRPVKRLIVPAAVIVLLLLSALYWNDNRRIKDVIQFEQQAMMAFQNGDYPAVIQLCEYLQEHKPQRPLSYLLLGKVNFTQGKLERANVLFNGALAGQSGDSVEKAEALIGLGRVASVNGHADRALDYYRQAAEVAPSNDRPYIAQALLLDRQGSTEAAGRLLLKARSVSKDPQPIDALWSQVQAKASLEADEQRMSRIDQLIDQLSRQIELADDSDVAARSDDDWTSRPITIWLMDIDVVGYDLREGQGVLLTSALSSVFMENGRLTLVERSLLDKVLSEMKLGASRAADQQTILRLGRLTAARLIVFGRLVNYQGNDQVVLRCVDVESGQVKAVVQAVFDQNAPLSEISRHLARELFVDLADQYPLRGKIIETRGEHWAINLGRAHGAYKGMRMRSATSDLIVEILSVDEDESLVHIIQNGPIEKGLRLEAILS